MNKQKKFSDLIKFGIKNNGLTPYNLSQLMEINYDIIQAILNNEKVILGEKEFIRFGLLLDIHSDKIRKAYNDFMGIKND